MNKRAKQMSEMETNLQNDCNEAKTVFEEDPSDSNATRYSAAQKKEKKKRFTEDIIIRA